MYTGKSEGEQGLYAYMAGWRIGARGGALTPGQLGNADMANGFASGVAAASEAEKAAGVFYGARLSILRES